MNKSLGRAGVLLALSLLAASAAQAQLDPDARPLPAPAAAASPAAALDTLPLPRPPLSDQLLPFELSGAVELHYLVDPASVVTDGAALVSYTLVARSSSGFDNVSFESVDCASGSWRVLAVLEDQGWRRVRNARWQPLGSHAMPHGALAQDDLCSNGVAAGTAQQIVQSLRLGRRGGSAQP